MIAVSLLFIFLGSEHLEKGLLQFELFKYSLLVSANIQIRTMARNILKASDNLFSFNGEEQESINGIPIEGRRTQKVEGKKLIVDWTTQFGHLLSQDWHVR